MVLRFFGGKRKVKLGSTSEDATRQIGGFQNSDFSEIFFRIHAGHVLVVVVIVIVIVNNVGSSKILLLEGELFLFVFVVFVISVVLVMFGGSADGHFFGIGRPLFGLG